MPGSIPGLLAELASRLGGDDCARFQAFESVVFSAASKSGAPPSKYVHVFELRCLGLHEQADRAQRLSELLEARGLGPVVALLSRLRLPLATCPRPAPAALQPLGWAEERADASGDPLAPPTRALPTQDAPAESLLAVALGFARPPPCRERARDPLVLCGQALAALDAALSLPSGSSTLSALQRAVALRVYELRTAVSRMVSTSLLDFNRQCEAVLPALSRLFSAVDFPPNRPPAWIIDHLHDVVRRPGGQEVAGLLEAAIVPLKDELSAFFAGSAPAHADFLSPQDFHWASWPLYFGGQGFMEELNASARFFQVLGPRAAPPRETQGDPADCLRAAKEACAQVMRESSEGVVSVLSRMLLYGEALAGGLGDIYLLSDNALAHLKLSNHAIRGVCQAARHARTELFFCQTAWARNEWFQKHQLLHGLEAHLLHSLAHRLAELSAEIKAADAIECLDRFARDVLFLAWRGPGQELVGATVANLVRVVTQGSDSFADFVRQREFLVLALQKSRGGKKVLDMMDWRA